MAKVQTSASVPKPKGNEITEWVKVALSDAEGVGSKAMSPGNIRGTPNAFYAEEWKDGTARILPDVVNTRNSGRL